MMKQAKNMPAVIPNSSSGFPPKALTVAWYADSGWFHDDRGGSGPDGSGLR
jgi:hypothetical protein